MVGPSGAGKTTVLRAINRLIELEPGLSTAGDILLDGQSIHASHPDALRRRIGMLFQQPQVFPGSILDNAAFGLRHLGGLSRRKRRDSAERALAAAALWDEVRDRLKEPASQLSVGQQQRLCLARALALDPEVLLLDEPTSALDPRSTALIEESLRQLARDRTLLWVTHDRGQAERVATRIARFEVRDGVGVLAEVTNR